MVSLALYPRILFQRSVVNFPRRDLVKLGTSIMELVVEETQSLCWWRNRIYTGLDSVTTVIVPLFPVC